MISRTRIASGKGFTVVEVLVSVGVLAVIGGAIALLVAHSVRGWSLGMSRSNASSAAALAVSKLGHDICVGSGASVAGGELNVTVPPLITDVYGETYYDTSASPSNYRYYLSNGVLYRQIDSATPEVFVREVSSVTFSVSGNLVSFIVTGSSKVGISDCLTQSCGSVVLRNHKK